MSAKRLGIFLIFFSLAALNAAYADSDTIDARINLTTDQTKILHLQTDAANVIINNPEYATVALETPRLLIITPHETGTTSMIILDDNGKKILQRDIIVSNVQSQYVRIRRICGGGGACKATTYAYCPDGCYEVTTVPASGGSEPPPPGTQPGTIGGEPAETLIGPADDCPEGYNKIFVPGIRSGDQHYTCTKR